MPFSRPSLFTLPVLVAGLAWLLAGGITKIGAIPAVSEPVARLQAELPERKFAGLDEILRKALENGPSVIIREWDAAVAREQARGARAPMLPSLNAVVNAGVTREERSGSVGYDRNYTAVLYSVGFYQPVFHWGALSGNYQIAQLRQAMSARNIEETRRLLAIDIRRRYFDIILAANALKLAQENMRRLETDRKNMEQMIADGSVAPGAIDGSNRAIDLATPELEQAGNQYATLRQSLAQLAGMPESALDNLPDDIPGAQNITDALNAVAGTITAPPSAHLDNLQDEINVAKLDYKINKVRQLPKFGISASVGQSPDTSYGAPKSLITSWNTSLSMQWNLFDGFASQAGQRASLNRLRMLETQRAQAGQQESLERRNEAARLLLQWKQLQNTERDVERSRAGYELAEQDFANGMAAARNVEDSRLGYKNSLQGAYAARANFYIALVTCLSNRGQDPAIQPVK